MFAGTKSQRYFFWLALGTLVMAIAMASLLVFELAQKRSIVQSGTLRSDSLTALVFQFEREFLRLRQTLDKALNTSGDVDTDTLSLRYDIFISRVNLLHESQGTTILNRRAEYRDLMPRLDALVRDSDVIMGQQPLRRAELQRLLEKLNELGPDVQALSFAADSEVAFLLERQSITMLDQNNLIVGLTLAQLMLLIVAATALARRQVRQESERLALERLTHELSDARIRADDANRGKDQFLANMSHELRTPFNGVMGMLGLLESTPMTSEQSDYLKTAQRSAAHLLTLLNDILDVSALDSGKMKLKPQPVLLARLVQDVEQLMRPQALGKGLAFSVEVDQTSTEAAQRWVMADATRLKQILFNLISNAIKFTERGEVTVRVTSSDVEPRTLRWEVVVRDSGIGMAPEELANLFQRFFQADSGSTRRFGGTGLGLEISQSLAHMMGGAITVRSLQGEGSEFILSLALSVCDAPSDPAHSRPAPIAEMPGSVQRRVLVVEDHPINQKLVGVLLTRMGCAVTFADNGQIALELLGKEEFDLILMDINMPVMDGLTATRAIRAMDGPSSGTPVVVFTADVMNEATERAMEAGADDFLGKPVQLAQLRATLQKYLAGDAAASPPVVLQI
jgi:signal transduction histidine kinase/ActR/RegA family two-component response regulator